MAELTIVLKILRQLVDSEVSKLYLVIYSENEPYTTNKSNLSVVLIIICENKNTNDRGVNLFDVDKNTTVVDKSLCNS